MFSPEFFFAVVPVSRGRGDETLVIVSGGEGGAACSLSSGGGKRSSLSAGGGGGGSSSSAGERVGLLARHCQRGWGGELTLKLSIVRAVKVNTLTH